MIEIFQDEINNILSQIKSRIQEIERILIFEDFNAETIEKITKTLKIEDKQEDRFKDKFFKTVRSHLRTIINNQENDSPIQGKDEIICDDFVETQKILFENMG
jgi:signal recognition particle GTPase